MLMAFHALLYSEVRVIPAGTHVLIESITRLEQSGICSPSAKHRDRSATWAILENDRGVTYRSLTRSENAVV